MGLEKQGVSFQQNAKMEGKKYTKVYTAWADVSDWASKQKVLKSMLELYEAPELNDLFRKIAQSVESMTQQDEIELEEEIERKEIAGATKVPGIPRTAFQKFCTEHGIDEDSQNLNLR